MITLVFHLEMADNESVWWIDSPDVAGFYAAASTLKECRQLAIESLANQGLSELQVVERLDSERPSGGQLPAEEPSFSEHGRGVHSLGDDALLARTADLLLV